MYHGCKNIRSLAINVIAIVALITVMSTLAQCAERSVNAQMIGDLGRSGAGNTTASQHQQWYEQRMIYNGTINLEQTIF